MGSAPVERLADVVRFRLDSLSRLHPLEPKKTQRWLADQLGLTPGELSKRLTEQKAMGDDEVVHMAEVLGLSRPRLLLLAAEARCAARERAIKAKARDKKDATTSNRWDLARQRHENARGVYRGLLSALDSSGVRSASVRRGYVSLEDFPDMVSGRWTVLVGDRRERPAKGLGDLVGLSIGSSDFMYLHRLTLPAGTVVRSDKILLIASEASLRELMKTNLLIIGSPAVSLGARAVLRNAGATFMFNIGSAAYDRERRLYERLPTPATREEFAGFQASAEVEGEIDDLLATYRKNGFVDPIDFRGIRGRAIGSYEDYGMVALAPNPWSEEHIACICAGVHGGGTAGAVQLLASPANFANAPWGGVYKVSMSDQVAWEKRFENLAPRCETHPYDPDKYVTSINELISRAGASIDGKEADDEVRQVDVDRKILELVRDFSGRLMKWPGHEPKGPPEHATTGDLEPGASRDQVSN
jgi:hypothetical protein